MHELSIAVSIVEMVEEELARRGNAQVSAVHLRLGALSGVVGEALLFSYEVACAGTPLQGSKLVILDLPVIVHCAKCDVRRTLDSPHWLVCPVCETPAPQLVQGKELEIAALELIEQDDSELEMHT